MEDGHASDVAAGTRFTFGENWSRFLSQVTPERIRLAERSLQEMLGIAALQGRRFIDVGSGSGLFSLAARNLGAVVHSFDYDPRSVACTAELKRRYFAEDESWTVERGSVLDKEYLATLGKWDIVYSWGVLHHTGQMWTALENIVEMVGPKGVTFIAIYNDQGHASRRWLQIKKSYNRLPPALRWTVLWPACLRLWGPTMVWDVLRGRPLHTWRHYGEGSLRGMSPWRDVVDWVGGLPFEVAKPEAIFAFYRDRGFALRKLRTCAGGLGCNEFVFAREARLATQSNP
jgi:SAM-dependent methyltransferase